MSINNMSVQSGRILKEDNTTINQADILADVYDEENHLIKTSASVNLSGITLGAVEIKDSTTEDTLKVNSDGSIDVNVDGVATSAKQDTIIGHVDGIETLLTSIKDTDGIKKILEALPSGNNTIGKVIIDSAPEIEVKNDSGNPLTVSGTVAVNSLPNVTVNALPAGSNTIGNVGLSAGTNQVGRFGYSLKRINTSFTRPADTTAYAIGDAVTNSTSSPAVFQLDLSSIGAVAGQSIEIRKLAVVSSAKQSTLPLFNVYLSPITFTATNDNSALDIDDTTMESGGSWIALDFQNYTNSNSRVAKENANTPFVLAGSDTKIYGTIQAGNAYTPASGEKFTIIAWIALL